MGYLWGINPREGSAWAERCWVGGRGGLRGQDGGSAAAVGPEARIRILEKGDTLSYAACGLPFLVPGGSVPELKDLLSTPVGVVRDAHFFRAVKDVEVFTSTLATRIDRAARTVTRVETATGAEGLRLRPAGAGHRGLSGDPPAGVDLPG